MLKRNCLAIALVLTVPLLSPACAVKQTPVIDRSIDDATISTRVKTALLNQPGVGFTRIDVDTVHGVVTLSGTVKSKEEEQKVIETARGVTGVREVKSALQIVP
jgi:hyperosmotically inducible protein